MFEDTVITRLIPNTGEEEEKQQSGACCNNNNDNNNSDNNVPVQPRRTKRCADMNARTIWPQGQHFLWLRHRFLR